LPWGSEKISNQNIHDGTLAKPNHSVMDCGGKSDATPLFRRDIKPQNTK
jgi:hypothetical protein